MHAIVRNIKNNILIGHRQFDYLNFGCSQESIRFSFITLMRYLHNENVQNGTYCIDKVCRKFNFTLNGVKIILCFLIKNIDLFLGLFDFFWFFGFLI